MQYLKKIAFITSTLMLFACANRHTQSAFHNNPVVAHRGAWEQNNLPQNSIAALQHAIALNCTGAEFDVWMTADDSLVINHDADYTGMLIEKTNYKDLLKHPLSNGEQLPTLHEYLTAGLAHNHKTRLVCEIKPSKISVDRGRTIAKKVVQMISNLNARHKVMYISFDYEILLEILKNDASAITQYLNGDKAPAALKADKISGLDYHYDVFKKNPQWIDEAKKLNMQLNVWTVNKQQDIDWFLQHKFDYITTNKPELVFERYRNFKKQ